MNVSSSWSALRRSVELKLEEVRQSRFFHDRLSLSLLMGALFLAVLNLVVLAAKVRWSSVAPVGFSSFEVGYVLGPWYYPYFVALFSLVTVVINGLLAYQAFNRSRLASFFLLTGGGVVAIFCFIISNALAEAAR